MIGNPIKSYSTQILVICGPMKSGKTHELLIQADKLDYSKIPYVIFKPNIELRNWKQVKTRYSHECKESILIDIDKPYEMLSHIDVKNISLPFYVLIDEVQFFDKKIVDFVFELYSLGISFILAGLDSDACAKTFGPMGDLLVMATHVNKLTAVCEHCCATAIHTSLKKHDPEFHKNNIRVNDDLYEVVCSKCFFAKSKAHKD